jgi:ADP-ribosylglycohydrolase
MVLPHLRNTLWALWTDSSLSARITHDDSSSVAAGVAFIELLWNFLTSDHAANGTRWKLLGQARRGFWDDQETI